MNKLKIGYLLLLTCCCQLVFAGNEDRAGEAGASEILINPWARSSGWAGANTASVRGIEAVNLNVAGLAFTRKTEITFSSVSWLSGSDIRLNSLGFAQKLGESSVIGVAVTAMDFGDIEITTVDLPEGGLGEFSPNYSVIGVSYAKAFSESIYGGITTKIIGESIADVAARGLALDAGVNYVTGENDELKFGITLRNVGPPMKYQGNGLATRAELIESDNSRELTVENRSNQFELPSQVNIGLSYDFFLTPLDSIGEDIRADHRLTVAGNFTSNSFTRDQFRLGVEYGFREMFMVRAGYTFEQDVTDEELTRTASNGLSAGATIEVPLGSSGSTFGIDYSYRATRSFDGTHSIGIRFDL